MNPSITITRVAERHWHALEDDRVVGRGEASPRPDGRLFLSIDSWHGAVFDQIADVMLAELPTPLYTVVDEADGDLTSHWQRSGFTTRRREWEYAVPTDVHLVTPPAGVTILPVGEADEAPLRELDREIRDEVEASIGWLAMPAEVLPRPAGDTLVDPSKYGVAVAGDRYVGLVRVTGRRGISRIGLIGVRAEAQRRGIARALLADVLTRLHDKGLETACADVNEANEAAVALFEGFGARRASSNLELVLR